MNDDVYSYRDGLREGVVFLLLDDKRRVLIECRTDNQGKFNDLFYLSGSIEIADHKDGQSDYRETALRREVGESCHVPATTITPRDAKTSATASPGASGRSTRTQVANRAPAAVSMVYSMCVPT